MTPAERTPDEPSDEALMKRFVEGDADAFRILFERYHPLLLRVMRRRGASATEASDYVQQTFLQLYRARYDYREDRRLKPYIMTIALNVHRGEMRRRGRHPEEAVHVAEPTEPMDDREAVDPVERQQEAARLRAALAKLPSTQREVIEMHWFQELPFSEIAEVVGASLSAVKVRASRGYGRLRELLDGRIAS